MLQMQPTKQKTNLKTKEPWGARSRGVLLYAPTLMSGLGVTLVAHTHLKGSVWSTSRSAHWCQLKLKIVYLLASAPAQK